MPLRAAISQLFGYIYCMILSSMLTDMPVYGGVLYLCGKAVLVFAGTYGKDRKFLPFYAKRWTVLLMTVLLVMGILLAGIFPATIQSEKTWILFAAVVLCICAEANTDRVSRIYRADEKLTVRAKAGGIFIQIMIITGMSVIIFTNFGWKNGWAPAAGFMILVIDRIYVSYRLRGSTEQIDHEADLEESDFRKAHAYHSMEWVSLLLVMAVELTVTRTACRKRGTRADDRDDHCSPVHGTSC